MGDEGKIRLRFDVAPHAKQRPRFSWQGRCYTPKETAEFEKKIRRLAHDQYTEPVLKGALCLKAVFYLEKPKYAKFPLPHKRPDLDNYVKALEDALNGVVWHDDSQIVELHAYKRFALTSAIVIEVSKAQDALTTIGYHQGLNAPVNQGSGPGGGAGV